MVFSTGESVARITQGLRFELFSAVSSVPSALSDREARIDLLAGHLAGGTSVGDPQLQLSTVCGDQVAPDRTMGIVGVADPGSFSTVTANPFAATPSPNCDRTSAALPRSLGLNVPAASG